MLAAPRSAAARDARSDGAGAADGTMAGRDGDGTEEGVGEDGDSEGGVGSVDDEDAVDNSVEDVDACADEGGVVAAKGAEADESEEAVLAMAEVLSSCGVRSNLERRTDKAFESNPVQDGEGSRTSCGMRHSNSWRILSPTGPPKLSTKQFARTLGCILRASA